MKRRPEVFLRQAEAVCVGRARCFNRENVSDVYDKQQTLIDMHGFDATRMFSMDESGITTVQKPDKVHGKKGKQHIGYVTNGKRGDNTTLVCCMSAGSSELVNSTWPTSTSCFIISAVFAGILAEVANVLDKDSLHASVSVQGCGGD